MVLTGDAPAMLELIGQLYPLCRSITGRGVRATLDCIGEHLPLQRHEVPTGTQAFDWTVPREWSVRDAYVADTSGRRVIDFRESNLHLVGYSIPIRQKMSLAELRPHLHSLPERPNDIPYRTSYYREAWGFCLRHRDLEALPDAQYEVCIDSSLQDGALSYAECVVPGESTDEFLFYTHTCHPSLCNDNLSGIAVVTRLAKGLLEGPRPRLTYRFIFGPTTIGSIVWLSRNLERLQRVRAGLVLTNAGDGGAATYKETVGAEALIDRIARHVLKSADPQSRLLDFEPYGYDERQFNSPGICLPVGRLTRTPNAGYPQYHTSADDLGFVSGEKLEHTLALAREIVFVAEHDGCFLNLSPRGEPQLGKRGLYRSTGGLTTLAADESALLWVLNQSDGTRSLLDIAVRAGLPFRTIERAAKALAGCGLLERIDFATAPAARTHGVVS